MDPPPPAKAHRPPSASSTTTPWPPTARQDLAQPEGALPDRHPYPYPYPNRYSLSVHQGDAGCTEAETVMTYDEAKALHVALGDALAWDGQ